jgi:LCP family protein required for cell wall assembly
MAWQSDPSGAHSGRTARVLVAVAAALSLLVAAGAGAGYAYYLDAQRDLITPEGLTQKDVDAGNEVPGSKVGGQCQRSGCNFLLLGSDSRTGLSKEELEINGTNKDIGGEQRSDTIIVVHIPPGEQEATILHFPRDLWVDIALPNHGKDKINAAFEGGVKGGGPQVVASTIQRLSGLHINHWMYVDLAGFEGVVDALGGVHMCVPSPMYDPLTGLSISKPGCRDFDGRTALAYVRTRHWSATPGGDECDAIGDFARIGRQQQFLRAVLTKILSPGELAHVGEIVPELLKNFVVDKDLNLADMAYFVSQLQGISTGAADFRVVPTEPDLVNVPQYSFPLSVVRPIQPEMNDLFHRLVDGKPLGELGKEQVETPPSPANISIQVFDHGSEGTATTALTTLQESGFLAPTTVQDFSTLPRQVKGSALLYRKDAQPMADVVSQYLPGLPMQRVADSALPDAPVAAVISSGYHPEEPGAATGGGGGGGGQPASACPT